MFEVDWMLCSGYYFLSKINLCTLFRGENTRTLIP